MTAAAVEAFVMGTIAEGGPVFRVESVATNRARVRLVYDDRQLRPGGTVSGPALMALADCAIWAALTAMTGPEEMSVTTNLTIDFLRRPEPADVIADAALLKVGRRLATGTVTMFSDLSDKPVAHATVTYARP